ncbi:MAG: hypothetical protein QW116_05150 [Zestosphaera sp.]
MPQPNRVITDVEAFHSFLNEIRKSGRLVRVVSSFDVESITAGGVLFKALNSMELDAEFLPDYISLSADIAARVIGINILNTDCSECLIFQASSTNQTSLLKRNYVVRYTSLLPGITNLLNEFVPISKEIKVLVASAVCAKYIPRLKELNPSDHEKEFLSKLGSEGLLESVDAPLVPYFTSPTYTADMGLDPYITLTAAKGSLSETLTAVAAVYKIPQDRLKLKTHLIKFSWFVRDLTTLAYFMTWLLDVRGYEGYLSSMISPGHLRKCYLEFIRNIKYMKSCLEPVLSEGVEASKVKYVVIKGDPARLSATVIGKVLWSFNLIDPSKTPVIIEYSGKHYIPLSYLTQNTRRASAPKYVVQGGYLIVPNASEVL